MTDCSKFLPPSGSTVKLIEPPRGSWARAGETYRVEYAPSRRGGKRGIWPTSSVRLWSDERDCGTIDGALFWKWARFEVLPA